MPQGNSGNFVCEKCQKRFPDNANLRRHLNRKKPCVVTRPENDNNHLRCLRCNHVLSSSQALKRHQENNCHPPPAVEENVIPAPADPVTDVLPVVEAAMEAGPLLDEPAAIARCLAFIEEWEPFLLALRQSGMPMLPLAAPAAPTKVTIRPFNAVDGCLTLTNEMVIGAFAEEQRLLEYLHATRDVNDQTAATIAKSFVLDTFQALILRAHASQRDPSERNVFLNPRRADQACVYVRAEEKCGWAVRPLQIVITTIADELWRQFRRIVQNWTAIPNGERIIHISNSVGVKTTPEIDARIREFLGCHLQNIRPKDAMQIRTMQET